MKKLKLIHTADWHLSEKSQLKNKAIQSLDQMLLFIQNEKVDGILIAGDLWDRIQPFGNNSAIKIAYDYLAAFSLYVDFIFIIKGNNSHDAQQSIELLNQFRPNIFAFENNVSLGLKWNDQLEIKNLFNDVNISDDDNSDIDLLLHGISYPVKANLIESNSIDEQTHDFLEIFSELMDFHGEISSRYLNTPKITLFHGTINGTKLSSGQSIIGQDLAVPQFVLEKTLSDYYGLGHIHLPQNISPTMRYCGSLYNKDFGETEQKYFDLLELDEGKINVTSIPLISSRPMIIIDGEFRDGEFYFDRNFPLNSEIKFRFSINENQRGLLTNEKLMELKNIFGSDVKIELNVIPMERIGRSLQIMKAPTLIEEIKEYARVVDYEIDEGLIDKVSSLMDETLKEDKKCA